MLRGQVEGAEFFDAPFWRLGRAEATIMDPQQRMFLQTAYHAVEPSPDTHVFLTVMEAADVFFTLYSNLLFKCSR